MKQIKFFAYVWIVFSTIGIFYSCVGDDSHKINGYGWGTVKLDQTDFSTYVVMDNGKDIFLKGNLLTEKMLPEGQRVFVSFTIDYDNQPKMNGVDALFATFQEVVPFSTQTIEPAGSGSSFHDKMYVIFTPWVTYNYDGNNNDLITFNTGIFWEEKNTSYEFKLTYANDYQAGQDTAKFILSYYKGTKADSNIKSVFHSYYLPTDLKDKCTIQVRFNAMNAGDFEMKRDSTVCITYDKKIVGNQ